MVLALAPPPSSVSPLECFAAVARTTNNVNSPQGSALRDETGWRGCGCFGHQKEAFGFVTSCVHS